MTSFTRSLATSCRQIRLLVKASFSVVAKDNWFTCSLIFGALLFIGLCTGTTILIRHGRRVARERRGVDDDPDVEVNITTNTDSNPPKTLRWIAEQLQDSACDAMTLVGMSPASWFANDSQFDWPRTSEMTAGGCLNISNAHLLHANKSALREAFQDVNTTQPAIGFAITEHVKKINASLSSTPNPTLTVYHSKVRRSSTIVAAASAAYQLYKDILGVVLRSRHYNNTTADDDGGWRGGGLEEDLYFGTSTKNVTVGHWVLAQSDEGDGNNPFSTTNNNRNHATMYFLFSRLLLFVATAAVYLAPRAPLPESEDWALRRVFVGKWTLRCTSAFLCISAVVGLVLIQCAILAIGGVIDSVRQAALLAVLNGALASCVLAAPATMPLTTLVWCLVAVFVPFSQLTVILLSVPFPAIGWCLALQEVFDDHLEHHTTDSASLPLSVLSPMIIHCVMARVCIYAYGAWQSTKDPKPLPRETTQQVAIPQEKPSSLSYSSSAARALCRTTISLKNLTVYPTEQCDEPVLRNLNVSIQKGEITVILHDADFSGPASIMDKYRYQHMKRRPPPIRVLFDLLSGTFSGSCVYDEATALGITNIDAKQELLLDEAGVAREHDWVLSRSLSIRDNMELVAALHQAPNIHHDQATTHGLNSIAQLLMNHSCVDIDDDLVQERIHQSSFFTEHFAAGNFASAFLDDTAQLILLSDDVDELLHSTIVEEQEKQREAVMRSLKAARDRGKSVLVSVPAIHRGDGCGVIPEWVMTLADKVFVLVDDTIISFGTPETVKRQFDFTHSITFSPPNPKDQRLSCLFLDTVKEVMAKNGASVIGENLSRSDAAEVTYALPSSMSFKTLSEELEDSISNNCTIKPLSFSDVASQIQQKQQQHVVDPFDSVEPVGDGNYLFPTFDEENEEGDEELSLERDVHSFMLFVRQGWCLFKSRDNTWPYLATALIFSVMTFSSAFWLRLPDEETTTQSQPTPAGDAIPSPPLWNSNLSVLVTTKDHLNHASLTTNNSNQNSSTVLLSSDMTAVLSKWQNIFSAVGKLQGYDNATLNIKVVTASQYFQEIEEKEEERGVFPNTTSIKTATTRIPWPQLLSFSTSQFSLSSVAASSSSGSSPNVSYTWIFPTPDPEEENLFPARTMLLDILLRAAIDTVVVANNNNNNTTTSQEDVRSSSASRNEAEKAFIIPDIRFVDVTTSEHPAKGTADSSATTARWGPGVRATFTAMPVALLFYCRGLIICMLFTTDANLKTTRDILRLHNCTLWGMHMRFILRELVFGLAMGISFVVGRLARGDDTSSKGTASTSPYHVILHFAAIVFAMAPHTLLLFFAARGVFPKINLQIPLVLTFFIWMIGFLLSIDGSVVVISPLTWSPLFFPNYEWLPIVVFVGVTCLWHGCCVLIINKADATKKVFHPVGAPSSATPDDDTGAETTAATIMMSGDEVQAAETEATSSEAQQARPSTDTPTSSSSPSWLHQERQQLIANPGLFTVSYGHDKHTEDELSFGVRGGECLALMMHVGIKQKIEALTNPSNATTTQPLTSSVRLRRLLHDHHRPAGSMSVDEVWETVRIGSVTLDALEMEISVEENMRTFFTLRSSTTQAKWRQGLERKVQQCLHEYHLNINGAHKRPLSQTSDQLQCRLLVCLSLESGSEVVVLDGNLLQKVLKSPRPRHASTRAILVKAIHRFITRSFSTTAAVEEQGAHDNKDDESVRVQQQQQTHYRSYRRQCEEASHRHWHGHCCVILDGCCDMSFVAAIDAHAAPPAASSPTTRVIISIEGAHNNSNSGKYNGGAVPHVKAALAASRCQGGEIVVSLVVPAMDGPTWRRQREEEYQAVGREEQHSNREATRARLERFLARYCKEWNTKERVDAMLNEYEGREEELFRKLRLAQGPEPAAPGETAQPEQRPIELPDGTFVPVHYERIAHDLQQGMLGAVGEALRVDCALTSVTNVPSNHHRAVVNFTLADAKQDTDSRCVVNMLQLHAVIETHQAEWNVITFSVGQSKNNSITSKV